MNQSALTLSVSCNINDFYVVTLATGNNTPAYTVDGFEAISDSGWSNTASVMTKIVLLKATATSASITMEAGSWQRSMTIGKVVS